MRARVGILVLLTIAALAVFEAVSPPDQRLLFPSPASEPASAEPVLREMPADVLLLPVDDSTESLNLIGPALQLEAMPHVLYCLRLWSCQFFCINRRL